MADLRLLSSPGDDKVVAAAHAAHGLHDFIFIVFDDFDPLQALYPGKGRQRMFGRPIITEILLKIGNSQYPGRSTILPCMPSLSAKASTQASSPSCSLKGLRTYTDIHSLFKLVSFPLTELEMMTKTHLSA